MSIVIAFMAGAAALIAAGICCLIDAAIALAKE